MQDKNTINSSVILKRGREHSLNKRHHWLFSGAIDKIDGLPDEGDIVWIKSLKGQNLGYGFYGTKSIAVRILSFNPKISPVEQITQCLFHALKLRRDLKLVDSRETNSYRLFHSEGDQIPGLTIDKLGSHFVIQIHHEGLKVFVPLISEFLLNQFIETESIILKSGKSTNEKDNFELIFGSSTKCHILENNIKFNVDILRGQKTGFFLDQRKNRRILGSYANGKRVLNLFCFTGGFSIYALKFGAQQVDSVDSSENALEIAKQNIQINDLSKYNYQFIKSDCEDYLTTTDQTFDIVICDPPALVKNKNNLKKGLKHYQKLQLLALKKVNHTGLFFTFSCSQFVNLDDLEKSVFKAGSELGITLVKERELKQSPCHPINKNHIESLYLKGIIFKILLK